MNTPQPTGSYPQQSYAYSDNEDNIDFKRYISLFINNWYWFAISLFITLSIAYGINRWSEKIYTVSSTLLISDDKLGGGSSDLNIFPGANVFQSSQNLNNELGILKSFSLNHRVMQELPDFHIIYVSVGKRGIAESRMYKNSPFKVIYDNLENQRIGAVLSVTILSSERYKLEIDGKNNFSKELAFGENFNEMGFNFSIFLSKTSGFKYDEKDSNRYYFYFAGTTGLANQYRSKLSIVPVAEEATLVTLSTSGYVAQQEADYLNKLMEVYLQQGLEFKNQTAERTIAFIDEQVGSISDSLRKAESSLENFRLSNRLIDLSREGSIIQNKLQTYENERSSLILQNKYYGYLQDYINSKNETGDIVAPGAMGVTNSSVERLVQELSALQQQKNKLKVNISEDLPAIILIDNTIKDIKAILTENISSSKKTLGFALNEVNDNISQVDDEISRLPGTEIKLINIQRKFDLNNTVYTYLLEKRAEAGIARASAVSSNRIIDRAEVFNSYRIKPKPKQNLIKAVALGFFIPVLLIFLIDFLNNKIIDKKDVEKSTQAPILGCINHNTYKSELPVNEKPGSTMAESFRSIRSNLKYFLKDNENAVIAVSSTISGEGKTFISVNLANVLAILGKKVLVVGLDLRKPRIHKMLDIENNKGLSTYLSGIDKYNEIIQKTAIENLYYTPAGPIPPNPAELIESQKMKEFFDKARKEFDYIIIDTPPIAVVTDALLIASLTDMYLLVVRQRYTSKNTLGLIQELYRNKTLKNIGIVINDISVSGYYGYGLRYGYSGGYGYNYGYNYYNYYGKYGYTDISKEYYTND